ncbi:MAG: hypothetical protein C0432_04220 [Candidatus Puniceispirillum sp.]|nr:hypothetical protein [Candidatus Pelagibacter sp.]MBA4283481.1 hypothetical protein [Candidatus Puniceispirillum sp.]
MKKNVLNILIILLLNTLHIYAQKATLSPPARSITLRVGGGLATEYVSIDIDVKNKPSIIDPDDGEFSSNGHHLNKKLSFVPHVECGVFFDNTHYLGLLLSINFINAKASMKVPMTWVYNFKHSYHLKNYTNLSLKFGYKLSSNIMFFCLVGPSFSNWYHQTKTFYSDASEVVLKNAESRIKAKGLGVGAGIEYWLSKNTTVSFQYGLQLYKPKTINYDYTYEQKVDDPIPETRNGNAQKKVRLTHSSIGLRFSYFFSFK